MSEPQANPIPLRIPVVHGCARCGGEHRELVADPLTRAFAPREAAGVAWTHWFPCPTNGEPVLVTTDWRGEHDRMMLVRSGGELTPEEATEQDRVDRDAFEAECAAKDAKADDQSS
jgi:hypothetical protein